MPFRNPLRRSRLRWLGLGWVIAVLDLLLGGGYAVGGEHVVVARAAFAEFARVPGGLRTHGVIMFGLGLAIAYGLAASTTRKTPWRWLRRALLVCVADWLWTAVLYALAPTQPGGAFSWTGVVTWLALTMLPLLLSFAPPPPRGSPAEETALVSAVLNAGGTAGQATAIAAHYFRGGPP